MSCTGTRLWSVLFVLLASSAGSALAQDRPATPEDPATPAAAPPPPVPQADDADRPRPPRHRVRQVDDPDRPRLYVGDQMERGFVLSAGLGLSVGVLATGSNLSLGPLLHGVLSLGYKIDRVVLTMGLEFSNLTTGSSTSNANSHSSMTTSSSTFLLVPGLQVALLRSKDQRVELLGSLRVGFGRNITSTMQDPAPPTMPTTPTADVLPMNFMYEVAPGVRIWPHRHFAVNLLAGFRGDYAFQFSNQSGTSSTASGGTNGVFASVTGMGVF